eukprot:1159123-Pelagomonas_calceolata.AAC.6
MAKSSEHATGPFMASAYQIRQFVREHALGDRPHVPLWQGKITYLVPAGMYANQVWDKSMLRKARSFQVPLEVSVLHEFFKGHIRCEACNYKPGSFKSVFSKAGSHYVSAFLNQNNNKLHFPLMN